MTTRLSRQQKREQTRSDLLTAAARLFAQSGFERTSLDQVAAEAGYTKGAIYSNFANKEELILEVLEARFETTRDVSGHFAELVVGGAFGDARELFVTAANDSKRDGQNLLLLELWMHAIRNPDFQERFAAQMRSQRDRTTESVVELYERTESGLPRRTVDLARIAQACEIGLTMLAAIDPDTSPGLYVDTLAALLNQSPFAPEPGQL